MGMILYCLKSHSGARGILWAEVGISASIYLTIQVMRGRLDARSTRGHFKNKTINKLYKL